MKKVQLGRHARVEVKEAYLYYLEADPAVASRFDEEVNAVLRNLAENPGMYAQVQDVAGSEVRRAQLKTLPYTLIYVVMRDEVAVASVHHTSRDPAHWRDRVSK